VGGGDASQVSGAWDQQSSVAKVEVSLVLVHRDRRFGLHKDRYSKSGPSHFIGKDGRGIEGSMHRRTRNEVGEQETIYNATRMTEVNLKAP